MPDDRNTPSQAELRPDAIALFRAYRESYRRVFLDEARRFIGGANCTRQELDAIRTACISRAKMLRGPTGRVRGRPGGSRTQGATDTNSIRRYTNAQSENPEPLTDEEFTRDWSQHGSFRTICMVLGDMSANRPIFLEQILPFVGSANKLELSTLRKVVARRTRSRGTGGLIKDRGRPSIRGDEERMYRARIAVWRRVIDAWPFEQIAAALKIKLRKNRFNSEARIEVEGNADSVRLHLQRLEQYLAAALWRAMPPNFIRTSAAGSEIAPGALDDKLLQTTLEYGTGLPAE